MASAAFRDLCLGGLIIVRQLQICASNFPFEEAEKKPPNRTQKRGTVGREEQRLWYRSEVVPTLASIFFDSCRLLPATSVRDTLYEIPRVPAVWIACHTRAVAFLSFPFGGRYEPLS